MWLFHRCFFSNTSSLTTSALTARDRTRQRGPDHSVSANLEAALLDVVNDVRQKSRAAASENSSPLRHVKNTDIPSLP